VKIFSVRHSAQKPPSSSCVTSNTSSFMAPNYGDCHCAASVDWLEC
jgi:hypothetical protein